MGGCSAVNCTNSTTKGFRVFRFPKEPTRRAEWIKNVNRAQWEPGNNATLCEKHFDEGMWRIGTDGKKCLKPDAVPTIFPEPILDFELPANVEEDDKSKYDGRISHEQCIMESNQLKKENEQLTRRLSKLEKMFDTCEKARVYYKKQLNAAKARNTKLEKQLRDCDPLGLLSLSKEKFDFDEILRESFGSEPSSKESSDC